MEFWADLVTDKSFRILRELRKRIDFVLIGGWAVYFLTNAIKSKDIDIILDFETLSELRKELELSKTEFLKKYQAEVEGVSIDIYVPYYSEFVIPVKEIMKNTITLQGFRVPSPEILLILKQQAELARKDSVKGQKDRVDIIALLKDGNIDTKKYAELLEKFGLAKYKNRLLVIVKTAKKEFDYLGIKNPKEIKKIKSGIIGRL